MDLNILLQASEIVEVLKIKNVTLIGLLLAMVAVLIYDKIRVEKKHEKEKQDLAERIVSFQDKLEEEYKNSNGEFKALLHKYYEMSTKILERINFKL